MAKLVVLLRGINVGGHGKVKMADLRSLLDDLGYDDVQTVVQTGNIVLSTGAPPADVCGTIEKAMGAQLGVAPKVMVRTKQQFLKVLEANPYPEAAANPTTLHVAFLEDKPLASVIKAIDRKPFLPDTFEASGREIYFHLPNGAGRTKLLGAVTEKRLGVAATLRNWNTVTKLADLVNE